MASLQARHRKACALGLRWTPAPHKEGLKVKDCTCHPTFSIRGAAGKGHERIGTDLRDALRALNKRRVAEDEGQPVVTENVTFNAWGDRWLASLECKETTRISYRPIVRTATEVFGRKVVRKLTPADVIEFLRFVGERGVSEATRAAHMRVLSACLNSAVQHGYMGTNPVKRIPKGERPKSRRREAPYFEDDELPKLIAAIKDPLWRVLVLTALKTGMRQGEIVALTWGDVDLAGSVIHVRKSFTKGILGVPKDHEKREVELTEDAVKLLGEWWGASGNPGDDRLVFPRHSTGDHFPSWALTRLCLYPAMKRAGIERVGPVPKPRTFHSLRHTYARIVLEHATPETWLQRQLGHSSLNVTTEIYGHWSKAARKAQTARLNGAFVV